MFVTMQQVSEAQLSLKQEQMRSQGLAERNICDR
jgi:hypothetical protein